MSFVWKTDTGEADRVTGPNFISTSTVLLLLVVTACSGLKDESESLPPQSVSQATLDDSEFEEFVVTQEDESVDEAPAVDEAAGGASGRRDRGVGSTGDG